MHRKFQKFSLVSQLNSYEVTIFSEGLFSCHLISTLDNHLLVSSKTRRVRVGKPRALLPEEEVVHGACPGQTLLSVVFCRAVALR